MSITTAQAVEHLAQELRNDPEYWRAWKSSIAVAFQDAFNREHRYRGLYDIANMAAQEFLENLTHQPAKEKRE